MGCDPRRGRSGHSWKECGKGPGSVNFHNLLFPFSLGSQCQEAVPVAATEHQHAQTGREQGSRNSSLRVCREPEVLLSVKSLPSWCLAQIHRQHFWRKLQPVENIRNANQLMQQWGQKKPGNAQTMLKKHFLRNSSHAELLNNKEIRRKQTWVKL